MTLTQGAVARERNNTSVGGAERCDSVSVEHRRLLQVTLQGDCVAPGGNSKNNKNKKQKSERQTADAHTVNRFKHNEHGDDNDDD